MHEYSDFQDFYQWFFTGNKSGINISDWIFRGEGKCSYQLYPAALRESGFKKLKKLAGIKENSSDTQSLEISHVEIMAIRNFYRIANRHGLYVPNLEILIDYSITDQDLIKEIWSEGIISPKYYELFALAQHYFVPTRFLDWTFDIHIALWFAAISGNRHMNNYKLRNKTDENEQKFSIWLMNYKEIQNIYITYTDDQCASADISQNNENRKKLSIKFIAPPYANNYNLRSQNGILIYMPIDIETSKFFNKGYFGESIDRCIEIHSNHDKLIKKISFPCKQSPEVLRFLKARGYDYPTIYPGYYHIIDELLLENKIGHAK